MEAGAVGFVQEALRGFLKCLGLEGDSGKTVVVDGGEEVVSNPPPSSSPPLEEPVPRSYEPLPAVEDHGTTTVDPLVDVLSSVSSYFSFPYFNFLSYILMASKESMLNNIPVINCIFYLDRLGS